MSTQVHWVTLCAALALLLAPSCGGSVEVKGETLPGSAGSAGTGASGGTGGVSGHGGSGGAAGSSGTAGMGGAGGNGGSTGGSGATGGTSGAAGMGGGYDCVGGFYPVGQPVQIVGETHMSQFNPLLAVVDKDSSRLAVAVMEQATEGPSIPPVQLRFALLPKWGQWVNQPVQLTGTAPFVVGPDQVRMTTGSSEGLVAVMYPGSPSPPAPQPSAVFFNPAVSPTTGEFLVDAASLSASGYTQLSAFIAENAGQFLIGHQFGANSYWGLSLAFAAGTGGPSPIVSSVGCGNQPLVADAAASSNGFIFAFSSSAPFNSCNDADPAIGLPSRINFGFSGGPGGGFGPLGEGIQVQYDAVGYLQMTPATDDAVWLAYDYLGLTAEVQPPVQLVLLNSAGQQVVGPVSVVDGFNVMGRPSLTRMATQPVLAWAPPLTKDNMPYTIRVTMLRTDGSLSATGEVTAPNSGQPTGEVVAIGHPGFPEVIVAWSQHEGMNERVYAAKFFCALPD